jgi:large subunit ribosomal protein L6
MSRIAKAPIELPSGVEIKIAGTEVSVKGPKGNLVQSLHPNVSVEQEDKSITVKPANDSDIPMAGTMRSLVNNMVVGVSDGFEKKLTLVGVGYRAQVQGSKLTLALGYSHPIEYTAPEGVTIEAPPRPRSWSRAATSRKSARSLRKSAPSGRRSPTRARASATQTSALCGRRPRRLDR